MTKKQYDRLNRIDQHYTRFAERYAADVKANRLHMLPIKETVEDVRFLIDLTRDKDIPPDAQEWLANLDLEWQELEQSSLKAIDAGHRVPFGIGRLVKNALRLLGLVRPAAEPVEEPATL